MFGYIYKITNNITHKVYVGKHRYHIEELDPNYITSGVYINRSIEKYGIENFTRELVCTADSLQELDEFERYYIRFFNSKAPNGYNLTDGGDGLCNPAPEVREKLAYWKGKKMSAEMNEKRNNSLRQVKHTSEWIAKIADANKDQKPTEYTIQKSIERHTNTKWYNNGVEEHMFHEGCVPKGYTRGRLKNPFESCVGRPQSEETIEKISQQKRGSHWYNNGVVELMLQPTDSIPEGFVKGRIKKLR